MASLHSELADTLRSLNMMIEDQRRIVLFETADRLAAGLPILEAEKITNSDGKCIVHDLMIAKANVLAAMVAWKVDGDEE